MSENDVLNIRAVLEAIQKILHYTKNLDNADQLHSDSKIFDACMMNFIVIGEMVARLSDKVIEKNSEVEWYKSRLLGTLLHTIILVLMQRRYGRSLLINCQP